MFFRENEVNTRDVFWLYCHGQNVFQPHAALDSVWSKEKGVLRKGKRPFNIFPVWQKHKSVHKQAVQLNNKCFVNITSNVWTEMLISERRLAVL